MRFNVRRLMFVVVLISPVLLLARGMIDAREAARRSSCVGELKQLVLGLHNFHSDAGSFPPGTVPNSVLPPERRLSWVVEVWPRISGGTTLIIDKAKAWDQPPNWPLKLAAAPGVTYVGMTAADCDRNLTCYDHPAHDGNGSPRPLTFVGIAGLGPDAPTLPAGHSRAGVFGYDRTTRLADITDGTGRTMILAETSQGLAAWSAGGPSSVRGVDPSKRPHLGEGRAFGGYHPGGANVAMADGSVKFIKDSVEPKVFEAMSTIAGGEEVPD